MLKHSFAIALLLAHIAAFAQPPNQPRAVPEKLAWEKGKPGCELNYRDGRALKSFGLSDMFVMAYMFDDFGKTTAIVTVWLPKESTRSFEFSPENVVLLKLTGDSVGSPEEIHREDPRKMAKSAERRVAIASAIGEASAGMATQTSTATTSNGQATVTTPDYAAQQRARQQAAENSQSVHSAAVALIDTSLKRNTLHPADNVTGRVYFAHQKKGRLLLQITADDTVFEFPFDAHTHE